ncbi:hypothetical protein FRC02_001826, partial [Tulasnella sp. 418]
LVIVIALLADRFSNRRSRDAFPVFSLLISISGLTVALFISMRFTDPWFHDEPDPDGNNGGKYIITVCGAIVWASMLLLSIAALLQEDAVEEDTIEAEALGWLITQLSDIEKLHIALACIPSTGNTPMRRRKMLDFTEDIIASLIHSLSAPPEQRGVLPSNSGSGNSNGEEGYGGHCGMDHESRLMFYLTCLAELCQVIPSQVYVSPRTISSRAWSSTVRTWTYNNWHHIIIRPSQVSFTRELQFLHHWYPLRLPSFPRVLHHNLETLFTHHNSYIRAISYAALLQLDPWALPLEDISSWPVLRSTAKMEGDFLGRLKMLAELRMVTTRVIDMYNGYKTLNPSLLRYLYCYSDNVLKIWIREDVPDERFLETVMVLSYLILENDTHIPRVTNSGDSTPMKVARGIMALKRWIDRNQEINEGEQSMDSKLHNSFAHSVAAATLKYVQLAAKAIVSDGHLVKKEEGRQIDEDSVATGMACLERSLRHLATQKWPTKSLHDQFVTALETFHSINCDAITNILPFDPKWDVAPLMEQLNSRMASSVATVEDKGSAIRTACKLLNEVSDPSDAWELAADYESSSLPELIGSFIQDKSTKWRVFTLSTVLDTSILSPVTARSRESDTSCHDEKPSTSSHDTRVDTLPYRDDLVTLYLKILEDPLQLRLAISEPSIELNQSLVKETIRFIHALAVNPLPNTSILSTLLKKQYLHLVALIASHSDESLVSTSTCKSAVSIFGHLLGSLYEETSQDTEPKDLLAGLDCLKEITIAVTVLMDCHASMGLECIRIWVKVMEKVSLSSLHADALTKSGLVEALIDAVPWTDFGELTEDDRRATFDDLTRLDVKLKDGHSP